MRLRSKALTLIATMVAAFAILPALGAAADELPPGDYEVEIGEDENAETYGFTVDADGTPTATDADGVEFVFGDDDEDGVFEFELVVDGVTYEVAIRVSDADPASLPTDDPSTAPADDGAGDMTYEVTYEVADDDSKGALVSTVAQCALSGEDAIAAGLPNHGYFVSAAARGETVSLDTLDADTGETAAVEYDLSDEDGVRDFCEAVEALDELDGGETDPLEDESEELEPEVDEEEASHGAVVSTVAQCAPRGREARDAGLPNHGSFVSTAARGEVLGALVVGETTFGPYDLATQEGADALCADVPAMLTAEADGATDDEPVEGGGESPQESDGRRGGPGRSGEAPGRSGEAPGQSGQAPGQLKKNG